MRSQQDCNNLDMNGEKYINGDEGQDNQDDNVGQQNLEEDNDTSGGRVPETIDDDELDDGEVEDYNINDIEFANDEFSALNNALDELQGALDNLESRNDGIHQELLQLLQSNREMRTSLIEELETGEAEIASMIAAGNSTQEAVISELSKLGLEPPSHSADPSKAEDGTLKTTTATQDESSTTVSEVSNSELSSK